MVSCWHDLHNIAVYLVLIYSPSPPGGFIARNRRLRNFFTISESDVQKNLIVVMTTIMAHDK
jgi:hypothetical protein